MTAQVIPIRSFRASEIIREILRAHQLSPAARAVAITLASRANTRGEAWPQTRRIAEDAGITATSARRAVRELVACGILAEEALAPGQLYPSGRAAGPRARITRFVALDGEEVAARLENARTRRPEATKSKDARSGNDAGNRANVCTLHAVRLDSRQTASPVGTDSADTPNVDSAHLIGKTRSEFDPTRKPIAIQLDPRAQVREPCGGADGAAPSAYGASRAPTAPADGAKRRNARGDGTPRAVSTQDRRSHAQNTATDALRQRAGEIEAEPQVRRANRDDHSTIAACRVLAAVRGEAETYPAAWMDLVRARIAEGFSERELAAALAQAPRAPWYRDAPGRSTPGFVLATADRVAALAALAAQHAPAARIARAAAVAEQRENLPDAPSHETIAHAARLLAAIDTETPAHARRPRP